jgi:hypothetical protein
MKAMALAKDIVGRGLQLCRLRKRSGCARRERSRE